MIIAGIPFIPFLQSWEDVVFLGYVLARISGMVLVAPLFTNSNLPKKVKIGLVGFLTVLITVALYPDYRSDNPRFILKELGPVSPTNVWLMYTMTIVKEFLVGYLMGFTFSLIFESLLVAGQTTGNIAGLTVAEMIDPMSNTSRPIIAQMFVIFVTMWMLSLDLHHEIFQKLAYSFQILPIGNYRMTDELSHQIIHGSGRFLPQSMIYIAIPFMILYLIVVGLGIMAKIMPEMNVFVLAFPLKITVGFIAIGISMEFFPTILQKVFIEYSHLIDLMLRQISLTTT